MIIWLSVFLFVGSCFFCLAAYLFFLCGQYSRATIKLKEAIAKDKGFDEGVEYAAEVCRKTYNQAKNQ
jgi:hypothetical protein